MGANVLVDAEGAVRAWARGNARIAVAAPGGVFFGVPAEGATFPLLTVQRVGGEPDPGLPIDVPLIQFDAWGPQRRPGIPDGKAAAAALVTALLNAVHEFTCGTPMGDAVGLWAEVRLGPVWSPDPESGRARYVCDVAFGLRSGE